MANRTFSVRISTEGRVDAGTYKCDAVFQGDVNQKDLMDELVERARSFANINNGEQESITENCPEPSCIRYNVTYAFLNLESLLAFAQTLPYPQETRGISPTVNYTSLIVLI